MLATHTRLAILETALDLFALQGYEKTALSEVSDRLGVTKAALYYHFKSKDSILVELVTSYLDDMDALLDTATKEQPGEGREALLRAYLDVLLVHRDIASLLDRDISALSHPAIRKRTDGQSRRLRRLLAGARAGERAEIRAEAALGALRRPVLQFADVDRPEVRRLLIRAALGAIRGT
jgi:AcrR family transcriptional regulator